MQWRVRLDSLNIYSLDPRLHLGAASQIRVDLSVTVASNRLLSTSATARY